jgi:hypothetical protein
VRQGACIGGSGKLETQGDVSGGWDRQNGERAFGSPMSIRGRRFADGADDERDRGTSRRCLSRSRARRVGIEPRRKFTRRGRLLIRADPHGRAPLRPVRDDGRAAGAGRSGEERQESSEPLLGGPLGSKDVQQPRQEELLLVGDPVFVTAMTSASIADRLGHRDERRLRGQRARAEISHSASGGSPASGARSAGLV